MERLLSLKIFIYFPALADICAFKFQKLITDKFICCRPARETRTHEGEASGVSSPQQFGSGDVWEGQWWRPIHWRPTPTSSSLKQHSLSWVISVAEFVLIVRSLFLHGFS